MILKAPGNKQNIKTDALVEFVDVNPTLCGLAGLEMPFHLQGESFVPLAENFCPFKVGSAILIFLVQCV